jgi:UPF0755 protein
MSKIFCKKNKKRIFAVSLSFLLIIVAIGIYSYYKIYGSNVNIPENKESVFFYIKTGSDYNTVMKDIEEAGFLKDFLSFKILTEITNYSNKIKPGKYQIKNGMSNKELLDMLIIGKQVPIKLTFNNIRTKEQLISRISHQIEADSLSLAKTFEKKELYESWGFDSINIIAMFIPNTYELYWNTSATQFFERMHKEYQEFWNSERLRKAEDMGLTPIEVTILASIVAMETKKTDEMSCIAGVYINRLKKGIPLQADPTIVYANGDFSINRVLRKHLEIDSPYNTYKYKGLPPGPICLPEPVVVDKTLDYEKHDYLYFCAKYDFSGYHIFAKTPVEHSRNAARYHSALNKRKIK